MANVVPNLTYIGYTPGLGTSETFNNPDLTGFQFCYQHTGPGAPGGTGTQYATCFKEFNMGSPYATFPSTWGGGTTNLPTFIANNNGISIVPIIVWGSAPVLAIPTAAQILSFLQTLPAGQKCGFNYISEVESGSDGVSGPQYVASVHTFSTNLNSALATMTANTGSGFWNRQNFPYVHSALVGHYANPPDSSTGVPAPDPSFIPNAGDCDSYGMDVYKKHATAKPLATDPRVQGFVMSVNQKIGTNVSFSFPEYGLDGSGMTDAQRAAFLQQDFAYITGSSRPGLKPVMFWPYWYKLGNSGEAYPFSGAGAAQTIQVWQSMIAYAGGSQGQNVITITNPGVQNSIINQPVSLQINATDSNPALPLTYTLGSTLLPAGLHLNPNTGLITGTPTVLGTTNPITITATDPTNATASVTFSWVVNPATTELVTVINPGTQTNFKGAAITPLNIQATDSKNLVLTYSAVNLPAGLSISSSTGAITGTPTTISAPSVTVTATSPTPVSGNTVFTWNIVAAGVIVSNPGSQSNSNGDVVSLQMTASDSAGLAVTFGATGLPTGLSISAAGLISGTCTANGTFNVVVTGTDSQSNTGQAAFTWTVATVTVNVTNPGPQSTNQGTTASVQMTANDSADNAITAWTDSGTLPPGLAISSSGLISGTTTTAGVYGVTITATDSAANTGAVSFTWTVLAVASTLVVSITPAAGTDIFGNKFAAGVTVGAPGGPQTTIGLNGVIKYTPVIVPMPAPINGWTVAGHADYQIDVLGNLVVAFKVLRPSLGPVDGQQVWPPNTLPVGVRPPHNERVACYTDVLRVSGAAFESAALQFGADGSISCYGIAAAATRVDMFAIIPRF